MTSPATPTESQEVEPQEEEAQVDFNKPLMDAIFSDDNDWKTEITEALQTEGLDTLNTVVTKSKTFSDDYGTILHMAIAEEKEDRVAFILENYGQYIDYSLQDAEGKTLLMIAAKAMRPNLVEKILENAKKNYSPTEFQKIIDTPDIDGLTPLHIASYGTPRIAKLLIDNGASLTKEDQHGRTPLDCTYASKEEIVDLKKEISIDAFRHIRATKDTIAKEGFPHEFKMMLIDEKKPLSGKKQTDILYQGGKDVRILLKYFKVCCSHTDINKHHVQEAPAPFVHCRYGNVTLLLAENIKGLYQKGFKYDRIEKIITLFHATAKTEFTQQDFADLGKIKSYFKFLDTNQRFIEMFEEQKREQYLELFQTWLNHLKIIIPILKKYVRLGKEIDHLDEDIQGIRWYIDNFLVKCNDFEILLTWYNKMEPWLDIVTNSRRGQVQVRELILTQLRRPREEQKSILGNRITDQTPTETRTTSSLRVLPSSTSLFSPTATPETVTRSTPLLSSSRIISSSSSSSSSAESHTVLSISSTSTGATAVTPSTVTPDSTTSSAPSAAAELHTMPKEKRSTLHKRRLDEFADSEHYTATAASEKREKHLSRSSSSDKAPSTSSSSSSSSLPFSHSILPTQPSAAASSSSTKSSDLSKDKETAETDNSLHRGPSRQ